MSVRFDYRHVANTDMNTLAANDPLDSIQDTSPQRMDICQIVRMERPWDGTCEACAGMWLTLRVSNDRYNRPYSLPHNAAFQYAYCNVPITLRLTW
jgi:hypothetical protein